MGMNFVTISACAGALILVLSACSTSPPKAARPTPITLTSPKAGPPSEPLKQPEAPKQPEPPSLPSAPAPAEARKPPPPNPEAERKNLLELDLAFSRLSEEKGAAQAFYEFLAPDAVSLQGGEVPLKGREAIKVHLAAGPQGLLTWTPREAEVAASGDLGYTWGTYEFRTRNESDAPQIHYGKYVTLWKRQPDGSWKVALDVGSPGPPPGSRR